MQLGQGGGEIAANRALNPSGEDRLSALPDDALVNILLHLDTAAAVRTSVLSRRWRGVWKLLPGLRFDVSPVPRPVASALAAHVAALRFLEVVALDAAPAYVAAWLPVATSRLSGHIIFENRVPGRIEEEDEDDDGDDDDGRVAIDLPCFERATSISLDLGFLCLALPAAGVFARLTNLRLVNVRIRGPYKLVDAVSSPRCPCLRKLIINDSNGPRDITIRSESLLELNLMAVSGLQQLTVVAPALEALTLRHCFYYGERQPMADISAPRLVTLEWRDAYDPSSVHLCKMEHLQSLSIFIYPYGPGQDGFAEYPADFLMGFKALERLELTICNPPVIQGLQYLMEDITMLPQASSLRLIVFNQRHAFGASLFHLLKMCSGVRSLWLNLCTTNEEGEYVCPSGCSCDEPSNWKTEELTLSSLQDIKIFDVEGTDHEVAFVKRLFSWVTVPVEITFSRSISKTKARELCQTLSTFCKPGTIVTYCMLPNADKRMPYLLAP